MNYVDIFLLSPLVFLAIKGFISGFINQIAGLVGLIIGLYFAYLFYLEGGKYISTFYKSDYNNIIAFILILAACYLGVSIVGKLLTKASKALALSPLNRVLGLAFGALKGLLITAILVFALNYAKSLNNNQISELLSDSVIYDFLSPLVKDIDTNSISI